MKKILNFTKDDLISSLAFAFFVVCPRMAGMMYVIKRYSNVSMLLTVLIGIIVAVPLLRLMVYIFTKYGVWVTLGFCVFTDIISAIIMNSINANAMIETLIIALFMVLGVKSAPKIVKFISTYTTKKENQNFS